MNIKFLALVIVIVNQYSCGVAESSTYRAPQNFSNNAQIDPTSSSEDSETNEPAIEFETPEENQSENPSGVISEDPDKNGIIANITSINLGLEKCVQNHFKSNTIDIFSLEKPSQSLANFNNSNSIKNHKDFENLGNLILTKVVEPRTGLVDYNQIRGKYKTQWSALVKALSKLKPISNATHHRLSFWTNAYNISMMNFIVNNPSQKDATRLTGSQWSVFSTKIPGGVAGYRNISLNGIEKGILKLGGGTTDPYPKSEIANIKENRLHFALVCGAVGCPKLRNFMYPSDQDKLETVLKENTFMFFNSKYQIRVKGSQVQASSLLAEWYTNDFKELGDGNLGNLADYVVSECRSDKSAILSTFNTGRVPSWGYDWKVNEK